MSTEYPNTLYFNSGIPSSFHIAHFKLPVPHQIDPETPELEFKGTEWFFQAYKAALAKAGTPDMFYYIVEADTAAEAKYLGQAVPMSFDEIIRWNGDIAPQVMLKGCLAKFWQNEECEKWLCETGDLSLVEHRPDPIWGDNMDGSGKNLLGKILMVVRAVIS